MPPLHPSGVLVEGLDAEEKNSAAQPSQSKRRFSFFKKSSDAAPRPVSAQRDGLHSASPTVKREPLPQRAAENSRPASAAAAVSTPLPEPLPGTVALPAAAAMESVPCGGLDAFQKREASPVNPVKRAERLQWAVVEGGEVTAEHVDEALIGVFGRVAVADLRSSKWADRKNVLETLAARLKPEGFVRTGHDKQTVFVACVSLLHVTLGDKTVPVYLQSLELFGSFCSQLPADVVSGCLKPAQAAIDTP